MLLPLLSRLGLPLIDCYKMFFFKKKAKKNLDNRSAVKRRPPKGLDEKQKILLMIRKIRKRISPEVLNRAEQLAFSQMGMEPPVPPENEASRLFKLAMENNGARRSEILALVERRVNKRFH